MLKTLSIEQFVIIDKLELDFHSGLTILTGETGAGKSILLDALGFMLGDTADFESIRQGSESSKFKAVFVPSKVNPVWVYLHEKHLLAPFEQEIKIERTFYRSGSEEIFVNERSATLEDLKKIGTFLGEIHGQFANQTMLSPENQMTLLDLSGAFPADTFKNVADALKEVHLLTAALEEENLFLAQNKREMPQLEDLARKFDKVGMKENFLVQFIDDYKMLKTAKETSESFQAILSQLISANGVVMGLQAANNVIERNPNLDYDRISDLRQYLEVALENVRAAVVEMRDIAPHYDIDLEPMSRHEDTMRELKEICKTSKILFENLDDFYIQTMTKLNRLRLGKDKTAELQDLLIKAKNNYRHHAHILTQMRIAAGKALSQSIITELEPLKLPKAEFQVKVEEDPTIPWTDLGFNRVVFEGRMNPGTPFSPVSQTASGGELARMVLAMKVVLQRVQTISTLVFDEVDTGIGGAAAAAVGERISLLADSAQVLVITHSPQVAARGHQHLHVSKKVVGETTTSEVSMLTVDQRIEEISRMLAGDELTGESKAAAISLMKEAYNAYEARQKKQASV